MISQAIIFASFILLYFAVAAAGLSDKSQKLIKLLKQIFRLLFNSGLNNEQQEKIAARFSLKIFFYSVHLVLIIVLTMAIYVSVILGLSLLIFKNYILYETLISMKGFVISLLAFVVYLILKKLL